MSLGQELLVTVLDYALARLRELEAAALADVDAFATALGIPGFVDAGGVVENHLQAARTELDATAAAVAVPDVPAAADHLGAALGHVRDAAAAVPGGKDLTALLGEQIPWAGLSPKGLARQLGLPSVPGLTAEPDALAFRLTAGRVDLAPAPLAFGFASADLTARLRWAPGSGTPLSISLGLRGLQAAVGGGALSSLLGGSSGAVEGDIVIGVDTGRGLTLQGGASPRVVLPARAAAGPLDLRELGIELPAALPDTIDVGAAFTADLGGVVAATVEGAGVHVHIAPARIADGANPLSVSLKSPSGIGLSVDAGIIRGGGFLDERSGGFGGALQLRLGPVDVKAVGLLTLEPSFALVVVLSVEFTPPIDLTFGFTLNAVGGVLGIEHRLDTDALRGAFTDGALDHVLFPPDPVAAAPAILSTLEKVFPVDHGSFVIGPMIELGWGRPVSFLTAQLGVILSLPDPKIVIIGRMRLALPAPQVPIVDLRATLYGEITPDHLLILVSLRGSRIAGFTVGGDIGFLVRWSGDPMVAISAGGFHPRYTPPRELAGMERLHMDLSPPAILHLRAESYFALTSNSVQLGSRVEMGADLGVASITGYFQFDALVVFAPRFMFMIDLGIGLTVRALGVTLCGVTISLHLEGPGPWRAQGSAEVEILWWTVPVDVGPFTWGDDDNPPPPPADPRRLVRDALHHNPGAWQALTPPDSDRIVTLVPAAPSDTDVTVHPLGLFDVRQHAVPLETQISRVGPNPVPESKRRVHLGVPLANGLPAGTLSEVRDEFSAGTFLDLTDDQKLSRPDFEQFPAGVRARPPGEQVDHAGARQAELRYETFVADDDALIHLRSRAALDTLFAFSKATTLGAGAAARSPLRARTRYDVAPDPIVLADPAEAVLVSKATLAPLEAAASPVTYTHAAEAYAAAAGGTASLQIARLGVS